MEYKPKNSGVTSGILMAMIGIVILVVTTIWFLSKSYYPQYYWEYLLSAPYFHLYFIGLAFTVLGIYQYVTRKRMKVIIHSDSIDYLGALSRFDKSVFFKDLISIDTLRFGKGVLTILRWKCHIPDCPGCSADRIVLRPEFNDYFGLISDLVKNAPPSIIGEGSRRYVARQEIDNAATSKEAEFQQVVTKYKETLLFRLMTALNILAIPISVVRLLTHDWGKNVSELFLLVYTINMIIGTLYFFLFQREHLKLGGRAQKTYNAVTTKIMLTTLATGALIIFSMIFYEI